MLFKHRPKDDGGGGEAFSTLEANESRNEHLVSWPLSVDSDKQVVIYDETQAACFEGLEVVGKYQTVGHAIWPLWRKLFFFTGLTAVITTAAVLAGVFGSRRSHAKSSSPALNSATGFNITFPLDAVVSPRNIAAVSYTLQSTNNTSLYFQDNEGQLWEAANNGSSWSNRELGFTVANGSALAAAVSNPSYPFVNFTSHSMPINAKNPRQSTHITSTPRTSFTISYTIPPTTHGAKEHYRIKHTKPCRTPA